MGGGSLCSQMLVAKYLIKVCAGRCIGTGPKEVFGARHDRKLALSLMPHN